MHWVDLGRCEIDFLNTSTFFTFSILSSYFQGLQVQSVPSPNFPLAIFIVSVDVSVAKEEKYVAALFSSPEKKATHFMSAGTKF